MGHLQNTFTPSSSRSPGYSLKAGTCAQIPVSLCPPPPPPQPTNSHELWQPSTKKTRSLHSLIFLAKLLPLQKVHPCSGREGQHSTPLLSRHCAALQQVVGLPDAIATVTKEEVFAGRAVKSPKFAKDLVLSCFTRSLHMAIKKDGDGHWDEWVWRTCSVWEEYLVTCILYGEPTLSKMFH